MSVVYGQGKPSTDNLTLDLALLDPFAEDSSPLTQDEILAHGESRTSSFWRGSIDRDVPNKSNPLRNHTRSRTEHDVFTGSNNLHPLRSAGLAPGPNDAGVTRPHLSRVLNVGIPVDGPPAEEHNNVILSVPERDVLVHQVSPQDSLAGVSLKYGISLSELRRANHLWASDSIHLRTQLYVPIDKASRLKTVPIPVDNLISLTPEEQPVDPENTEHDFKIRRPSDAETIRRVPTTEMSFFPPPVNKSVSSSQPSHKQISSTNTDPHHSRYTSHPSNSLTSLLTSFPIAPSTRDTIIARLSFDSASSGYGEAASEGDSHELDDVSVGSTSDNHYADDQPPTTATLVTPKASHHNPNFGRAPRSPPFPSPGHARHLSSSPHSYIPSMPQIRTVQLEPSPEMQIPLLSRTQMSSREQSLLD